MEDIQLVKDLDVSQIKFGGVRTMDNGGKLVQMGYEGKSRFVIQTPEMRAPFGINTYEPAEGPVKHSLDLSFQGADTRPTVETFLKVLKDMDELIVQTAFENCNLWFRKKYNSIDIVKALYSPMVKYSKDKDTGEESDKYAPTVKLNLPQKDDKLSINCYDKNAKLIDLLQVPNKAKGSSVTAIVQLGSIWLAGGKFGCTPRVVQLQVIPPSGITSFAFKKNDEDRLEDSKSDNEGSVDEDLTVSMMTKSGELVDDEDDDDDDEDDDDDDDVETTTTPVVEETPVVAKKPTVVKSKK